MKTEEKIKEAIELLKDQIPSSIGEETRMLQGQFSALSWVLKDDAEEPKPEE